MSLVALIVEDSLTVRMDLKDGLDAAGFETRACRSLAEAREAMKAGPVDVVLLDVRLGDGDGLDLLAEIRASEARRTPVILLSSEREVADRIRGLARGADEYSGKPYVRSFVVARAQELALQHRGGTREGRRTVLVIDDSLSFREAMREALETASYRAVTAESGERGLELARANRPSLVIVDGHLPGIDGATVIRRVRLDPVLRRTPCIMITGSDGGAGELGAFEAGVDVYLHKTTPPVEIVARVGALLATGDGPAEERSALEANKLLVVGDQLAAFEKVLAEAGFDVARARGAEEALQLLEIDSVACVLVDVSQPAQCRAIRAALEARSAILAVVPDADSRFAVECLAAGADEVVPRDTREPVLVARLRAQLRRKQIQEELHRERRLDAERELAMAEARAAQALAEERARHLAELERKNEELAVANSELSAFSYSVSHDLRAPLRAIAGFTRALEEDHGGSLEEDARQLLQRVTNATQRMSALIDDLLTLSRVTNGELRLETVDLSAIAREVAAELAAREPQRKVAVRVTPGLVARGDPGLVRALLENLVGNAWKFTQQRDAATIEVGELEREGERIFFVRDDGVGFDPGQSYRLFRPFQRLHSPRDFEGTGIGLATVRRIVVRHGGRAWLEPRVAGGTTAYFTLA